MPQKSTAYWIAFGPHGPRSLPPPDEGKKVALGVAVGVLVSLALFSTSRMFAKPAPHTMTKEWQEQANEYLKVRLNSPRSVPTLALRRSKLLTSQYRNKKPIPSLVSPRPTTRARDKSSLLPPRLKQLQDQGEEPELDSSFSLLLERTETKSFFPHGLSSMYKMIFRRSIGAAHGWMDGRLVVISRADVNTCCTTILTTFKLHVYLHLHCNSVLLLCIFPAFSSTLANLVTSANPKYLKLTSTLSKIGVMIDQRSN